jgi:hypothetical protein
MSRTAALMILTATLLLLTAAPAVAKEGFYLGVNVPFNDINGDVNSQDSINTGNGRGLRGGYGLSQYISIEAGYWKTKHTNTYGGNAADLEAGTVDLKINIPHAGNHIEPYLLVGAGRYTIEQNRISRDGKGSRIGIGMDIYLFPALSLNLGFTHNNVTFTNAGQDIGGKIATMDFGLTYHFI